MRRDLAKLIRSELTDPRMSMVSISEIEVTRDYAHGKVYITLLGDSSGRDGVVESLNKAAPMLRGMLGREMRIRKIPQLQFVYDESIERGADLESLIHDAVADDVAHHQDDKPED